jgi:hypothetical protein
MRTRQPQPSWEQVSSVPASFAIYSALIYLGIPEVRDPVDTYDCSIYPPGVYATVAFYLVAVGEGGGLALNRDPEAEPCRR